MDDTENRPERAKGQAMNKKYILPSILLLIILISPAAAGNFTNMDTFYAGYVQDTYLEEGKNNIHFDLSGDGYAITNIQISVLNRPSQSDFTLTMLDGSTHVGSILYTNLTAISCDITLLLDGNEKYWTYYAPGGIDILNHYLETYAKNADTGEYGIILMEQWVSFTNIENYVFSPDIYIASHPIVAFDITSDSKLNVIINYANTEDVKKAIADADDNSPFGYAVRLYEFAADVIGVLYLIMRVFVTLIINHFFELVGFYMIITTAYCAGTSRDLITFGKKWLRYQRSMLEFTLDTISTIFDIFYKGIQALVKWWS